MNDTEEVYALWKAQKYMDALRRAWQPKDRLLSYKHLRRDGMDLRALVFDACREAVRGSQEDPSRAQTWLTTLLDSFQPPLFLVDFSGLGEWSQPFIRNMIEAHLRCTQALLDHPQWIAGSISTDNLGSELENFAKGKNLALGFLRDLICRIGNKPLSPAVHTEKIAALLIDVHPRAGQGVVARLKLQRLASGMGRMYPDPVHAFDRDDTFRRAEEDAYRYVRKHARLWTEPCDVRWRLERSDSPIPALTGPSMGGAFALGLCKLFADKGQQAAGVSAADDWQLLNLTGVAITAKVTEAGMLEPVGGAFEKLLRAARDRALLPIHTVIVSQAQDAIEPAWLNDDPHAEFRVRCAENLPDAAKAVVYASPCWGPIIDCREELRRHQNLVGREWLTSKVRAAIQSLDSGYILLVAGPGFGKSALVAEMIRPDPDSTVHHLIQQGMGNWAAPAAILRSLTAQLRRKYRLPVADNEKPLGPSDAFVEVLRCVASNRPNGEKEVVYLDGLDEAFGALGDAANAVLSDILPRQLPRGIVIVMTSRSGDHLRWLADPKTCHTIKVAADEQENNDDIRTYLRRENEARHLNLCDDSISTLLNASEGCFEAACRFLDDPELPQWRDHPASIPHGLDGWLASRWARLVDQAKKARVQEATLRAVLGLLATAFEPISREHLTSFLEFAVESPAREKRRRGAARIGEVTARQLLHRLDTVLRLTQEFFERVQGPTCPYRFFHSRLREFVDGKLTETERAGCHRLLAEGSGGLGNFPDAARDYARRHRLSHLSAVEEWDKIAQAFGRASFVADDSTVWRVLLYHLRADLDAAFPIQFDPQNIPLVYGLLQNPHTPPDALKMLAERGPLKARALARIRLLMIDELGEDRQRELIRQWKTEGWDLFPNPPGSAARPERIPQKESAQAMEVSHVGGDIIDIAPDVAEAAVLWLRGGFNLRFHTWHFRLQKMISMPLGIDIERPWLAQKDSVWPLEPRLGQLRYVYVFANPGDSSGCRDLAEVRDFVHRSLDGLSERGVRRVAMIHIPTVLDGQRPRREADLASAKAMVEALRSWDTQHPGLMEKVVLVDLGDGFAAAVDFENDNRG